MEGRDAAAWRSHFARTGQGGGRTVPIEPLEDRPSLDADRSWQRMAAAGIENPLLRSGLAVAGANRFGKEDSGKAEDGILTAQEISALDLTGTELVVLSACDTGLGQVHNGEGVFGLRRAFLHAGAKTLLMSLAKVPDKETKELMVEFYTHWLKSGDKVKSLRDAQLAILHKRRKAHGAAHPLFWGMFVAMGDPK
ncbi:MAG: CHAT domain-containing protein [Armatimonadetes bacterium]|nr:CHAT domain-containing protein [Armatimonadota bacterium]